MVEFFSVIGNPIAHSLSPYIHESFAQQCNVSLTYTKIQGDDHLFETQVKTFFAQDGRGLNITMPFKERAYKMAAVRTERCQQAGAANTLWVQDQLLRADNTDGIGLLRDLVRHLDIKNKSVLILGAGGAARGIIAPLFSAGVSNLSVANRSSEKRSLLLQDFPALHTLSIEHISSSYDLIINATSTGLSQEKLILPDSLWQSQPFCYDLAYQRQHPTIFLQEARVKGCVGTDGLGMLVEQAAESFSIWWGKKPETQGVLSRLREIK